MSEGRKDVERMTVGELKTEIAETTGAKAKSGKRVSEYRAIVAELRAKESAEPAEAEPVADPAAKAEAEPDVIDGDGLIVDEEDTALVPPEIADEVGQAIALREHAPAAVMALPTPQEFNAAQSVALAIASTGMVPEVYRGRPDDVLAAILFGREIGLGPMTALRDIYMIEGRPALAAHRQLGTIRRGGVVILESEATDDRARILARRTDTGEIMDVEFTMDEAKRVVRKGKFLVDGDNWKSYPRDMLWARCVGRLTRRLGPDLIGGLPPYVAEEVADFEGWGVEYGEQGQVRVGRFAQRPQDDLAEPIRRDYPDFNIPKQWGELFERMTARIGRDESVEWVRQAVHQATGSESLAALPVDAKRRMFQKCCLALAALERHEGDLAFDVNVRKIVADAFAPRLDGVLLDGPPWRLAPTEEDRPTHDDWLADQPTVPADEPTTGADGGTEQKDAENEAPAADDHHAAGWGDLTPEEQADADRIGFGDDVDAGASGNPYST